MASDWEVVDVDRTAPSRAQAGAGDFETVDLGHSGNNAAGNSPTSNEWEIVDLQAPANGASPTRPDDMGQFGNKSSPSEPRRGRADPLETVTVEGQRPPPAQPSVRVSKPGYWKDIETQKDGPGRIWVPPETDAEGMGTVLQQLPGELATQAVKRVAGAKEYIGEEAKMRGLNPFGGGALKEAWQVMVLPRAVHEAIDQGIVLTEHPDIVATAERLGLRPDVFARDWPKYVNLAPAEKQKLLEQAIVRAQGGEQLRAEGAAQRVEASNISAAYRPRMQEWSPQELTFSIATSIPDLMVAGGASIVGGPTVGVGAMFSMVAPGYYADGRNLGLEHGKAETYAMLMSMSEVVPELPVLEAVARTPGARKAMAQIFGDFAAARGGRIVAAGGLEAGSEMITEALQIGIESGLLDEHTTLPEALERIAHAGVIGFLPGATLGAATQPGTPNAETRPQPGVAPQQTRPQPGENAVPAEQVLGEVEPEWEEVDVAAPVDSGGQPGAAPDAAGVGPDPGMDGSGRDDSGESYEFDIVDLQELGAPLSGDPSSAGAPDGTGVGVAVAPVAGSEVDARIADEAYRDAFEGSRIEVGTERGGRLVRTNGDEGEVTGRTPHVASPFWKDRPTKGGKISADEAHDALDKVQRGETDALNTRQRRYLSYIADEADVRRREWAERQELEAPRHHAEIVEAVPDFEDQDDTTQDITMLAKVASQYATEEEIETALEAQSDREAITRLQRLVDRGWQERPSQAEGDSNVEATAAGAEVAAEPGLEQSAQQGAPESVAVETEGANELPSDAAGLTAADHLQASPSNEGVGTATAAPPPTDLFGTNLENSDALNKRNAKVARKLGEGRAAPPVDAAPRGDMFREQAETIRKEASERQTSIVGDAAAAAATNPANEIPEPTPAQKEAGNYAKGHVSLHGLDMAIENPEGSHRWKLDVDKLQAFEKEANLVQSGDELRGILGALRDSARIPEAFKRLYALEERLQKQHPAVGRQLGRIIDKSWHARLAADYGYIKGYIGKDKDHLDVYLGPRADTENAKTPVFVMDQKGTDGKGFDEHKVFIGFPTEAGALTKYVKSFDDADFAHKIAGPMRKFESVDAFKEWLTTGDLKKPVGEWKGVQRSSSSVEPGGAPAARDRARQEVLPVESGRAGTPDGRAPAAPVGEARKPGGARVSEGGAAAGGAKGDRPGDGQGAVVAPAPAGSAEPQRSGDLGLEGAPDDRVPAERVARAAVQPADLEAKRARQKAADTITLVPADRANIGRTLPFLNEGQQDDVQFAETRFEDPAGYGVVFTNGTGTGKTYSGLGIVKRAWRRGKRNILIVTPNDNIISDWIKSGKNLSLDITQLPDTGSAGNGIVATTYANLGQNNKLAERRWDLVVVDESHYLSANAAGELPIWTENFRGITLHPDGWYARAKMLHPEIVAKLAALQADIRKASALDQHELELQLSEKLDKVYREEWQPVVEETKREIAASQGAARPRVTFLSATPFAYDKSVEYAEGYLFEYGHKDPSGRYNDPNARQQFFIEHFGYRMKTGKLTRPDAGVDRSLMEIQFNNWLKNNGVLSSRILDSEADYERKFVLVESAIGKKIDDAIEFLNTAHNGKYRGLADQLNKTFDYLARMFTLEAIKARAFLPMIRAELAAGRKVVVFHDYNKGGAVSPFKFHPTERAPLALIRQFEAERPDLADMDFSAMSPLDTFKKEFPQALFINGNVPKGERRKNKDAFNSDDGKHNLIIVQSDAGREGTSLHDTTGKYRRTLFNLGMPVKPVAAIQIEGRTRRTGSVTDALYIYGNTGTSFERWTFAQKIAERSETAENLAMGEEARGLKRAFIDAFEDAVEVHKPSEEDGRGGKAVDRAMRAATTPFQKAKTYYFAQQKKTSRNKSREGADYYATPEPLGAKMVEWADIKPKEDVLEPSAGHGAIARFFPEDTKNTAVEPSPELASRVALVFRGKVEPIRFEDLHKVNNYDAIVMNPPFGHGGKTAVEHLAKAVAHLRDGGRVVAIIPRGPAADKQFDNWFYGDGTYKNNGVRDVQLVAKIELPSVTFERAGTKVATRVVILERQTPGDKRAIAQVNRDYSSAETIEELFDRIENSEVPPRLSKPKRGAWGKLQYKLIEPRGWEVAATDTPQDQRVLRAASTPKTPIPRAVLQAHIERLAKTFPLVDVHAIDGVDGIDELQDEGLLDFLAKYKIPDDRFGGVTWKRPNGHRVIYLNSRRIESLSHAEQILFHEATHRGFRAALGDAGYSNLADYLFLQAGGTSAFQKEKSLYFDQLKIPFDVNNKSHRLKLVDERLAKMAETIAHGETLTDQLAKMLDAVLAWVNRWFRARGWRRTFSKAEIREAIRGAVQVGMRETGFDPTIETPARSMAEFAAAAKERVRKRPPARADADEVSLELKDGDEQLRTRQQRFWDSIKKGQYIERAVRLAFLPPGLTVNEKGEWTPSELGRRVARRARASTAGVARHAFGFMRPLAERVNRDLVKEYALDAKAAAAWEAVKSGLVDRYKTPAAFILADSAAKNARAQILDRAKRMVADLETSGLVTTRAEAEALQAVLTGESENIDAKMAAIAEPIRQVIDQWGAEAVELGLLDRATFERNRATYLHRVYRKHEADYLGASGMVKRVDELMTKHRRKIIGNQFKRRGIAFDTSVEKLRRALPPDWWARKTDGKKIDVALGESEWVVLSKVTNPREQTPDMLVEGAEAQERVAGKDRVVDRVYWPAELPVPPKFAGWRNDGTFKAIKVFPDKVTLWRDFTKPERMKMGEILDARYTFLKTALTAAHDLSTGRLFKQIAMNPEWSRDDAPVLQDGTPLWTEAQPMKRRTYANVEWVHVPDTTIPGTSVKRYGAMAGKYVRAPIWRDLNELEIGMAPGTWKWVLTQFKKNKTTRNPKTHIYNTMSNVILAYIDDMRASDWIRGLKDWVNEGPIWQEARLHGVFGHDFVDQEIRQDILKPMIEKMLKEGALDGAPEKKFKLLTRLFDGIRAVDRAATWAYQAEDEIFRMASFMIGRNQGMSPDEAAIHARKQFIDYDIRAPWIKALRSTVIPFIAYPYRAIPRVMDAVVKRPWKIATLALLTYAVNELAFMAMDDDDEDLQRRLMNENLRGNTWAGTPRLLRLPMNDEYENPVFLDLRNGLPAANIVDFENSYSAVPTPAWMQIGGPLVMGVDFMQNYNAYRQEPITDSEVDTLGQKTKAGAAFLWSSYMPSWAPGGYAWDKVAKAVDGRMNQAHETSTIGMAVAQSVLPIRVESTEKNRRDRVREYERKLRKLSEDMNDLQRDFQQVKSPSEEDRADLREALEAIESRREQVMREMRDTLNGPQDE